MGTATFQSQASPGNSLAVSQSMMALAPAAPNVPVIPPGGGAFLPAPRPKAKARAARPNALAKAFAKPTNESGLCKAWLSFKVSKTFELVVTVIAPSPPAFVRDVANAQKIALESMLKSDGNQEITGSAATVLHNMKLIKDDLRLKGWRAVECPLLSWTANLPKPKTIKFVKIGTAHNKQVMTGRRSHLVLFGHWP